ncbi:MAG: LytTR family DNA-binding domain-containing protein [Clostridiales bacterium]|nr:LytTR family DNA-binding domain-containing protein [Clostridiales bacterium]
MKVAVCDDEIRCAEDIKAILIGLQRLHGELDFEIDCLTSGAELIADYYPGKYDVIFLDMLMPEIDGLELARRIRRTDWDVSLVFATCMDSRLPDGYDVMAADFIVKPASAERVEKLILKLQRIERQRRGLFHRQHKCCQCRRRFQQLNQRFQEHCRQRKRCRHDAPAKNGRLRFQFGETALSRPCLGRGRKLAIR